jgi:hypothetical protein
MLASISPIASRDVGQLEKSRPTGTLGACMTAVITSLKQCDLVFDCRADAIAVSFDRHARLCAMFTSLRPIAATMLPYSIWGM